MEKSNKFLKITGILMIIGGSFAIIGGIIILLLGALYLFTNTQDSGLVTETVGRIAEISIAVAVVGGIVQFITGIIGVKNAGKPEKANVCIFFGSITALFFIASQVLSSIAGGTQSHYNALSMIFGLLIPAFYLIGAVQPKSKEQ